MDEPRPKLNWKIWIYMTPVYILIAIPLVKWTLKNQSGEMSLSKDEYSAFNAPEGEVKKADTANYNPGLSDGGYSLHYRSGGTKKGTQEELDWGYQEGYLHKAVSDNLGNPKALDALFNNKWVVQGFMSRATVRKALGSPEALFRFLENTPAVNKFLSDRVSGAAINNPQVLRTLMESDMAKALLDAKAFQELAKNPASLAKLTDNNPTLLDLLNHPGIKAAVLANPQTDQLARSLGWKR